MMETELKELELKEGVIRTGIARIKAFSEAPQIFELERLWSN